MQARMAESGERREPVDTAFIMPLISTFARRTGDAVFEHAAVAGLAGLGVSLAEARRCG